MTVITGYLKEKWYIAREDAHGNLSPMAGPYLTEKQALREIGGRKERIIHVLGDKEKVSWFWQENKWNKIDGKN